MPRSFCTAGPVQPEWQYCLPPTVRVGLESMRSRIAERKYFILHAPRQTGKTTALRTLVTELQADGLRAVYTNIEPAQTARNDVTEGVRTILGCLARDADFFGDAGLRQAALTSRRDAAVNNAITTALADWTKLDPSRPTVLFLDEVDALIGDTLISLLRQIRAGYPNRPTAFPMAVILCGLRDVKDYRIHTGNGEIITGGSAFNIKDESLRLGDFTRAEVVALLGQHTAESGQAFAPEAIELVWELTQGQPWLVNALARQACFEPAGVLDRAITVDVADILAAKERLVRSRATHLDALGDKLMESRVRQVILPMLTGVDMPDDLPFDHREYVLDLGLIRYIDRKLAIANPIYREVIPRELTSITQDNLATRFEPEWCAGADGRIDTGQLIG